MQLLNCLLCWSIIFSSLSVGWVSLMMTMKTWDIDHCLIPLWKIFFNFHIVGFYYVKLMSDCHISIRIWCYHFLFGCKLAYFKMTSLSEMAVLDIYPEFKVCFQLHRGGCLFTWLGPRCASYSSAKCALNFLSNLHACSLILKNS